ncbi:DUF1430 domain-containing protein [Streptococcus halichoeri]|uniref:DUF1430 domain-containing protein n=1 Tax=Streptococcus halichoeri TaxID=254785 RepID=UPI00135679DE|nr:DUF1430 domain-containing protein [Streptococcus halichoeri]
MYHNFKRALILFSFLLLSVIGILFIKTHESELFGGFRDIIVVEKSTVDFPKELSHFVREKRLVLARRIVEPLNNETGQLQNTYVPIGARQLPSLLKQQKNKAIIANSSYNTVYVIVKGNMSANELARELSRRHTRVRVLPTQYETVLIRLLVTTPQSLWIMAGLLVGYASLMLAQHISCMKEVGILRISGKGKHAIALEQTYQDSVFILFSLCLSLLGVTGALVMWKMISLLAVLIVTMPLLVWGVFILAINFCLSQLFYYILQHQSLILSIKGKSPVRLIFVIVILTQFVTLFSVMYCVDKLSTLNQEIGFLKIGQKMWLKHPQFYEITSLEEGNTITQQQKANFFKAVSESTTILYRVDMLDNIAVLPTKQKSSKYEPTADLTSNVIYVNNNYVKETGLQLSKEARGFMSEMKTYDKMILIPNMQKRHFHVLKQQWTYFEERGFLPKDATFKNPHPNARINAFLYDGGDVFTYPVYSTIGRRCSNVASVKDPIIIVEKPNFEELSTATLLVNNPKTVIEMIRKHKLTALFGSLTNGRLSIETRMTSMLTQKVMLIISTGISILTSFLLFLLMNRVYFYQGRRVHFLERLAGQGLVAIHQKYLLTLCMSYVLLGLVTFLLGYSYTVATVPILYLSLLLLLFSCQLAREKRVHRDYLKGQ